MNSGSISAASVVIMAPANEESLTSNSFQSADRYQHGRILGTGAWGYVYEAQRRSDLLRVAVKKLKQRPDGIDYSGIREVKILQELNCSFIVKVGG